MLIQEDRLWTWLLPATEDPVDRAEWVRHGGKWIVFDSMKKIQDIAVRLAPFIEAGEIRSAKYWNGDPSAINVYSLDGDKGKVRDILITLGAKKCMVWEYDYALDKNIQKPFDFFYSWSSKFSTILRSYGVRGTAQLLRELLQSK